MDLVLPIFGLVIGALVLFVLVGVVIGRTMPQDHIAARSVTFRRSPEDIWAAINDPAVMGERGQGMGNTETVESVPPRLLVRKIVGEKDFGGTWTCEIAPAPEGNAVTITERGFVYNPFFRFMAKYVIGHHRSIDGVMTALQRRLS